MASARSHAAASPLRSIRAAETDLLLQPTIVRVAANAPLALDVLGFVLTTRRSRFTVSGRSLMRRVDVRGLVVGVRDGLVHCSDDLLSSRWCVGSHAGIDGGGARWKRQSKSKDEFVNARQRRHRSSSRDPSAFAAFERDCTADFETTCCGLEYDSMAVPKSCTTSSVLPCPLLPFQSTTTTACVSREAARLLSCRVCEVVWDPAREEGSVAARRWSN